MKSNDNHSDNITGRNKKGNRVNDPLMILTASSILGNKVLNKLGEHLGKVMDIMLNLRDGKIEYVVIRTGGFMGINQKYFAVPFLAMTIDTGRHAFILDQSKATFETHPGFDKNHWPKTNAHVRYLTPYGGFMGPNTGKEY